GLSLDELHDLAIENLDEWFAENPMELAMAGDEGTPRILMPNKADAYNTARLLSTGFHRKLQDVLGREFAVGIPSRDFFVAFSLDSAEALPIIRRKVQDDFTQMDHP